MKVAWLGDGNNVAHSWIEAACRFPFQLVLACPKGFEPNAEIWKRAKEEAGERITLTWDPAEAVRGAQVINTDVWASMGQEDQAAERMKSFQVLSIKQSPSFSGQTRLPGPALPAGPPGRGDYR